jgi:hypothetical protein
MIRLKKTEPFSRRLNEWIENRVKNIDYHVVNRDVPPDEILKYKGKSMPISSLFCENSIYGKPEINVMSRAWHDHIHLSNNFGFDLNGEVKTAFKQASELPSDWHYERNLILIEVIAQVQYALENDSFVEDQRDFTIKTFYGVE